MRILWESAVIVDSKIDYHRNRAGIVTNTL